jgi:hypothetical protein
MGTNGMAELLGLKNRLTEAEAGLNIEGPIVPNSGWLAEGPASIRNLQLSVGDE